MTDSSGPVGGPVTPSDVSVVVCSYSMARWALLERSIHSLLEQHKSPGEIVLVIDHNDDLLARCRATWPDLVVVPNRGPKGLSGARDTGAAQARGMVVAFLDDDAAADPDWTVQLAGAYDGDVLGVGGYIAAEWPGDRRPSWFPPAFDWVVGCSYQGLPSETTPVRNVIGANMSVRRDVLDRIGGFDPRVGRIGAALTGCEETEMYIRAATVYPTGRVLYEPTARVRHHVSPERARWQYFLRRCHAEGRSKAVVSRLSTRDQALSSERVYTLHVLPSALLRGVLSRDPRQGLAVALGLVSTGVGFWYQWVLQLWGVQ